MRERTFPHRLSTEKASVSARQISCALMFVANTPTSHDGRAVDLRVRDGIASAA